MKYNGGHSIQVSLLCMTSIISVLGQTVLNQVIPLTSSNLTTSPLVYSLPQSPEPLLISVASCSANLSTQVQFYATNNTSINPPGPSGGTDVFPLSIQEDGIGSILLQSVSSGGYLALYGSAGDFSFEVLVSDNGEYLFIRI